MQSGYLTEKTENKCLKEILGSSNDLVPKSKAGETGVPTDKKQIGQKAAAAVAVALNFHFSSSVLA